MFGILSNFCSSNNLNRDLYLSVNTICIFLPCLSTKLLLYEFKKCLRMLYEFENTIESARVELTYQMVICMKSSLCEKNFNYSSHKKTQGYGCPY